MKKKYTRKSALQILSRNGVEIKIIKKRKKIGSDETVKIHYITTQGTGIKLQGVCDYLIANFYDMVRAR
jgi:lipopolysaccharide export system protein LptC